MNKIEEFRYDVLDKLRQIFETMELAAILRDPAEGLPTYMLNVLHTNMGIQGEEVMGEYYFLPIEEENAKFHLFSAVITLSEEVPEDRFELLGAAANLLNFYLPVGSIIFSKPEQIMAYKYTSLIPVEATQEEAFSMADGIIGLSLHLVNQYVDAFLQLMRGEITLVDFEDELPDAFRS